MHLPTQNYNHLSLDGKPARSHWLWLWVDKLHNPQTPEVVGNPINTTSPNNNAGAAWRERCLERWSPFNQTSPKRSPEQETMVERLALLGEKCACLLFSHAEPLQYTAVLALHPCQQEWADIAEMLEFWKRLNAKKLCCTFFSHSVVVNP